MRPEVDRLRRVEIRVAVEPCDPRPLAAHAGDGAEARRAIAGEHQRERAGAAGLADGGGDAFGEPESRGAFGRKPVERNQHDGQVGMREAARQMRLDGAARGDAPALVQPPAVIGHDDDLHRARHAACRASMASAARASIRPS